MSTTLIVIDALAWLAVGPAALPAVVASLVIWG
jgi:hypothetical protein